MWAGMAKYGVTPVGRPSFAVESFGGQLALVTRYGRTTADHAGATMSVAQYHVPLGAEKALITLSYLAGDPQAIAAHDRLKNSFVIE